MDHPRLDEVGYWSEVKLEIIRKYAAVYSTILNTKPEIRRYLYIDGFAGPGVHISKQTGKYIPGSPLNAMNVTPPFPELHFIDIEGGRAEALRKMVAGRKGVSVYEGDCNDILLKEVFPRARYGDYRRALCLLDPYGLHLDWQVIRDAGQDQAIEIFLNFPVMDMNMNVLWRNPEKVQSAQADRMDVFWGDRSWRTAAYKKTPGLFGDIEEKEDNAVVAAAFRERLRQVAGFKYVPDPMPMRNSRGAVVYYLFFASPNATGAKIVTEIFAQYRDRGSQ